MDVQPVRFRWYGVGNGQGCPWALPSFIRVLGPKRSHQPGRLEGMYKENAINPRVTWQLKFPRFAVPADQTWSKSDGFPGMASLVYRTSKSD